jgi:hypothetical protein
MNEKETPEKITIKSLAEDFRACHRAYSLAREEIEEERYGWLALAERVDNWSYLSWVDCESGIGGEYQCRGSLGDLIFQAERGGYFKPLYGIKLLNPEGVEAYSEYSFSFLRRKFRKRIKDIYINAERVGKGKIRVKKAEAKKETERRRMECRSEVKSLLLKLDKNA